MRYFLIFNPGSNGGKSKKKFQRILELFNDSQVHYQYKVTTKLDDAYIYSVEANQQGYDVIAAVGGDGTINRVLNGFYDCNGKRISHSKLSVIYTGTSPDFCKSYRIPLAVEEAIKLVLTGNSKPIQVGKIIHAKTYNKALDDKPIDIDDENTVTRYFACCANFGIGAHVARNANSGIRKYIGDTAGTFISLLKTLISHQPCDLVIKLDNQIQKGSRIFNLSVGRTTYIASGIKVNNDLSTDDKRFYNLLVKNMKLSNWINVFKILYSGKKFNNQDIISLQYAKTIEIYGNSKNPELEFDGDPRGFLPCHIEAAQDPLDLICEGYNE